jgi:hypothetical protein
MIYHRSLAAATVAIASSLTLVGPAPATSVAPVGSPCLQTTVANREFGQAVRHTDMLAFDPNNNLGKQVFLALDNGLRLELNEDSSDMTFMGNFAIGHQVEICATRGLAHGATAGATLRAPAGTSAAKQPSARPGAASGLAFNITDRVTGTYGKARLTSHVFIPR